MPWGDPPVVVGTVAPGSVAHASDTITTTVDIPAGALVVLEWGANASRTPTSITGTAGLTFQQDAGQALAAGSGGSGWIYSARATSLIPAGSTVIVNFTTGTLATAGSLKYLEGADATAWKDVSTQGASASSAAWNTGTTAARAIADEVSIAMAFETGAGATTSTTDAPATELNEVSSGGRVLTTAYQYHTATGTSNITGAWDIANSWNAAIVSYKKAAAAGASGAGAISATAGVSGTGQKGGQDAGALTAAASLAGIGAKGASGAGAISATSTATGSGSGSAPPSATGSGSLAGAVALVGTGAKGGAGPGTLASSPATDSAGAKGGAGAGAITATVLLAGLSTPELTRLRVTAGVRPAGRVKTGVRPATRIEVFVD